MNSNQELRNRLEARLAELKSQNLVRRSAYMRRNYLARVRMVEAQLARFGSQ